MRGVAIIVDPDGPYRVYDFDGDADDLSAILGGWLEAAPTEEGVTIWVNEEGKLLNMPVNRLAMDVWIPWDIHGCMSAGDWVAGNAVVTGGVGPDGETLDITDRARRWVLFVAHDADAIVNGGG